MMMDYDMFNHMWGGGFGSAWFLMWVTYILFIVLLALGIAALIKYLGKK